MTDEPASRLATSTVSIIVAVIGLVGAMGAAIIGNWDKIASHSDTASAHLEPALPSEPALVSLTPVSCTPGDSLTTSIRTGQECSKFEQPRVKVSGREVALDACLTFSHECGLPLWEWFCHEMGFTRSGGARIVDKNETYVLNSRRFCELADNQKCAGPEYLICLK